MYMYIASGCVSRPPEECDPPTASLPGTEGATRVSKRGISSQRNPRGGMLITACNYIGWRYMYMYIVSGCISRPEKCDPLLLVYWRLKELLESPRELLAAKETLEAVSLLLHVIMPEPWGWYVNQYMGLKYLYCLRL